MSEYTTIVAKEIYRLYQAKPDNDPEFKSMVMHDSEILNSENLKSLSQNVIKECISELSDLGYVKRYIRNFHLNDEFFSFVANL